MNSLPPGAGAGQGQGQQQLTTTGFAEKVRSWVHFDNLAATFMRQAQQARSARARWEEQILEYLKTNNMTNAIIQISGGRITMQEEKHHNPLTLQRLESLLHDYFAQRPPGSQDETDDIMKYLRANRGATLETKLKKS
jgi:hypothetical protein